MDSNAQRTPQQNLRLRFVVLLHLARVFDHFEIAFMDNQAKITGVFSLLDSETVS